MLDLGEANHWKVLVMDAPGTRLLSPILKKNDLKEHGVTLFL